MSLDYIRGVVSGKKARYVDPDHAVDLDLVYVTDRIIIMGWPASGFAGTYRNKKSDVLHFLDKRHKDKYWVWNLCPLYENAYSSSSMHDRVSRYPFPDHHPPPLQLLPLAVREMTAWLAGDAERIAIIHCKAGKGRSGTLLCSYMLSLAELPGPPGMELSYSKPDRAKLGGADKKGEGWIAVGHGNEVSEIQVSSTSLAGEEPDVAPNTLKRAESSITTISDTDSSASIDVYNPIDIGDENPVAGTGQYDRRDGKVDSVFKLHSSRRMKPSSTGRGVSIPSQRRWCRYVNLVFTDRAPSSYGDSSSKIRIKSITLFLYPPTGWQKPLAKLVIGGDGGQGKAWVSIARYDDEYVRELAARGGAGEGVDKEVTWGGVGGDGKYDTKKMFRSCGKLTAVDAAADEQNDGSDYVAHRVEPTSDLVLERGREFRMKFHLGSLPLGWAWMIPAFHLPEPTQPRQHTLRFPKSQIDFAVGPGSSIHHIDVCLEELADDEGQRTGAAPLLDERQEKEAGLDDTHGEKVKEDGE